MVGGGLAAPARASMLRQVGLSLPEAMQAVGYHTMAVVSHLALEANAGFAQGFDHFDKAEKLPVDTVVAAADPADYDALVLPGGVINPDILRTSEGAMAFVAAFFEQGKPVGAICHGPWSLVETGVVTGRTVTSWPSLRTDIENAGGTWKNEELVIDRGLFTSRKPADLPAFCRKLVEEVAEGRHAEQREAAKAAR